MKKSVTRAKTRPDAKLMARYGTWIKENENIDSQEVHSRIQGMAHRPLISIVMPVFNVKAELLEQAIESVRQQSYPNWELCIADDASTQPHIKPMLCQVMENDSRIKVIFRDINGHISEASNSALTLASGEFIALLDNDDLLPKNALFHVVEAINHYPNGQIFYSDEDKIDMQNRRYEPYFKCKYNYDLFLSHNMISHLGVFRTSLIRELGGFRVGLEGSQDYDLALRCVEKTKESDIIHIPKVLYNWRVIPGSASYSSDEKPYAYLAAERALNDHLSRTGVAGQAEAEELSYRIHYDLPSPAPMVSIIIEARSARRVRKKCLDSILGRTNYPAFEVLVLHSRQGVSDLIEKSHDLNSDPRIRLLFLGSKMPTPEKFNSAVQETHGTVLAFLHDDLEIVSPDWLNEMVSHALRSGVGAVGAKLLYPIGFVQSGGFILGIGGEGHIHAVAHQYWPSDHAGYFGRAMVTQSYSALSGACLVVQKSIYEGVHGMNAQDTPNYYFDIDFCLRIRQAGYRNVWTPFVDIFHREPILYDSAKKPSQRHHCNEERRYMQDHWGDWLRDDPAYSPNLCQDHLSFQYPFRYGSNPHDPKELQLHRRMIAPVHRAFKRFEKHFIRPMFHSIKKRQKTAECR
jgi:O-antigen biosynthesis protein